MNEQHHGNLLGGAIGDTTQRAAQLATIAASAAQTLTRVRARRLAADTARDHAAADTERAVLRTEHAAARLRWGPAFERSFSTASAAEAAAVWAAAQPWVDHDPTAHEAAGRAEERLAALHPELIVRYQHSLADGLKSVDAMAEATAALSPSLGDVNAAAASRAIAGDERGEALRDSAAPDVTATVSVDEHTQGLHAGATHAAVSDAASARAALLAAQAYPRPLTGALGRNVRTTPRPPHFVTDLHHSRGR
jgi:hypothetical protein